MLSVPQATCAVYIGCSTSIMACFGRACSGFIYVDVIKSTGKIILAREKCGLLEALTSLRHAHLGSFFLEPEDINLLAPELFFF